MEVIMLPIISMLSFTIAVIISEYQRKTNYKYVTTDIWRLALTIIGVLFFMRYLIYSSINLKFIIISIINLLIAGGLTYSWLRDKRWRKENW